IARASVRNSRWKSGLLGEGQVDELGEHRVRPGATVLPILPRSEDRADALGGFALRGVEARTEGLEFRGPGVRRLLLGHQHSVRSAATSRYPPARTSSITPRTSDPPLPGSRPERPQLAGLRDR